MFVIVYNNSVVLGPMRWNRFRFENEILEECDVTVTLPMRNDNLDPIAVSDEIKILPIQGTPDPAFNPKIEFLNGPFWEFTDSTATMSYRVEKHSIDAVKSMLKDKVATERWNRENSGVLVSLNGIEYKFKSDKETRAVLQSAASNIDGINWKHDKETWIQMSNADVQAVLNSILTYVQSCFDWEFAKFQEIDRCETLEQLDSIVVKESNGEI